MWKQWPRALKLQLIDQVVDLEKKLATLSFDKQGCIYFKEGLRAILGEARDINAPILGSDALERFSIGPLTMKTLWTRSRQNLRLDRGPCK
jgi:hypothetical protein